ncbi:hypothetical protein KEM48_006214 [Puccinia striiformis f. sp. tritici PST-130]|nr:hypothetical protein KEM48_006214 [Puccinia striiformis f. sp. tritici PST-130]
MKTVKIRVDIRDEDCIPSSATRGDRTKCEGCRRRRVPCTFTYNPQNSTTSTDRGNIRNPTTTTDRSRRTENNSIVRRPGIDYDIELIRDGFNSNFCTLSSIHYSFPVPPPRYDEPDPIVLVESLANRATTPPNREIPQLVVPHHMISSNENGEEEAKKKEEENEAMRLRGEAIRRSVQEEVDRREVDNRIPILEAEMNRSTIDEAGARIDSGVYNRRSRRSVESRRYRIGSRNSMMQLLVLKKMGVYVDEEDIEEFKDLIKDINEGLILLEEDIKKM